VQHDLPWSEIALIRIDLPDLGLLGMGLGADGETNGGDGTGRSDLEAEEIPEVDSPLDEES